MMPRPNLRAARWYAERGIAVFPLVPGTKVPIAGSHGELDATTDPATINGIWVRRPDLLVAAALRFTDYFVVDVDGRHFGDEWLRALGNMPDTVTAISGSGWPSTHHWFRRTPDLEDVHARALTHGVDLKGLRSGYVILPPSLHPSGRRYEWEASSRIDELSVAEPPVWLVRMIKAKSTKLTASFEHADRVDPETFYLGALFKKAGRLGRQVKPGVFAVRCPNERTHSQGRTLDGSAVVFAPKKPGGRGTFFCQHTSACSEVWR